MGDAARSARTRSASDIIPDRGTVRVGARPHVARCGTTYRGKTGGYWRDSVWVERILDSGGREVEPQWRSRWTGVAPGISTRGMSGSYRGRHEEIAPKQAVRIDRSACPVRIDYRRTDEYEDYEDSRYASHREESWQVEYVAD